jgi:hypothetical protein
MAHQCAIRQIFACSQAFNVFLILGQTHFFQEFDACFQRSRRTMIEIKNALTYERSAMPVKEPKSKHPTPHLRIMEAICAWYG